MKQIADWALELAVSRGASHAEARIVNERARALGTRNGRVAVASDSESLGVGVRVLCDGGWGFAATQELTRAGVERCALLAVEIARASARVQREPVRLLSEPAAVAEWSSPC
jgi:TldD protein